MVPVTDTAYALSTLGPQSRSKVEQFSQLKFATIRRALPVPAGPVSPVELKAFKEKHTDELKQCREYLDARLAKVADIEDPQLRAIAEKGVLEGIEREIVRLREQMEKRK